MKRDATQRALAQLKLERLHVAPRAVELAPAAVQHEFPTIWAPLDELVTHLHILPVRLLRLWLRQEGGHVIVTHLPSHYDPGIVCFNNRWLRNVAYVSVVALASHSLERWVPISHMLDHLLGNGGTTEGLWLSDGGGLTASLRQVGEHLLRLFPLGYGFDQTARQDPHSYFARSLALFVHDRRSLNSADPLMEKLLRTTLLADDFWRPPPGQDSNNRCRSL